MIFVTVGTTTFPFPRLLNEIERLINNKKINEKVFIQRGETKFKFRHENCIVRKFFPFKETQKLIRKARIIICHGGSGSIFQALELGKIPIAVPRQKKFNEHVDNHQVKFVRLLAKSRRVMSVYKINKLGNVIKNYKHKTKINKKKNVQTNSALEKLFESLDRFVQEISEKHEEKMPERLKQILSRTFADYNKFVEKIVTFLAATLIYFFGIGLAAFFFKVQQFLTQLFGKKDKKNQSFWIQRNNKKFNIEEMF